MEHLRVGISSDMSSFVYPGILVQISRTLCEEPILVERDYASFRFIFSDGASIVIHVSDIEGFICDDNYCAVIGLVRTECMNLIDETAKQIYEDKPNG